MTGSGCWVFGTGSESAANLSCATVMPHATGDENDVLGGEGDVGEGGECLKKVV